MYAQLGNIRFEGQKGFSALEESFGVNYAQHERIKSKPRLERVGGNLQTVSFEMLLHSQFTDPEADIEAINSAMEDGEIMTLILGSGKIVGNFVIESFSKTTEFTDPNGNLISASISVELIESFSEDLLAESKKRASNSAFATNQGRTPVRSVLDPKLSPAMAVTANVAKIETSGTLIGQYAESAEANSNSYEYYSNKINDTLDFIESTIEQINQQLTDLQEVSQLPTSLQAVYTNVQNMKAILPITDINSFKGFTTQLKSSISNAQLANVGLSNQSIIRRK